MNITIIDGSNHKDRWQVQEKAINELVRKLNLVEKHTITHLTIADMQLNHCQGCWDCWVKTPGLCRNKDQGDTFMRAIANCDSLIYVSPIENGFVSSELKKAMDRSIPTALPYIKVYDGECHHVSRYPNPDHFSLMLLTDEDVDQEAIEIIHENFDRVNKNFRSKHFSKHLITTNETEALYNEISAY